MQQPYNNTPQGAAYYQSQVSPSTAAAHHLSLPYLHSPANGSSTSLLDAVVGHQAHTSPNIPNTGIQSNTNYPSHPASVRPNPPSSYSQAFNNASRDPSSGASSQSHGGSSLGKVSERGESDWDVVSASEGGARGQGVDEEEDEEAVKNLQEKVAKRRSQLPRLESQLADLEAQIKAAEDRLAQAQTGPKGGAPVRQ
ncbi:hypothetical protein B9479_006476 [Cryptococcus floricola]|uniref:Uncharacterized protein n=1 Tax=Cryptococcus floricola TaxID=2591691 RepID=A0A5D3AQG1_9TREE|nr:hypothetical protein B9479_006476 [Cryptococcus floricola]